MYKPEPPVYEPQGGPSDEGTKVENTSVVQKAYYTMMTFLETRPESDKEWECSNWCEWAIVMLLALLLVLGSLALTLYWVIMYRDGFSWDKDFEKQFNLHPVLMVGGFITFSGFSMLVYRLCRCNQRVYMKLFHAFFHSLSIPCIMMGFVAVFAYHKHKDPPLPHFYSIHSWLGCITMGLFALQILFGFIFFIVACGKCGEGFKQTMGPIHASFGITTFMLAVATCVTGLTEQAISTFGDEYQELPEEALIINSLAMLLVGAAIIVGYICARTNFKIQKPKPPEDRYEMRKYENDKAWDCEHWCEWASVMTLAILLLIAAFTLTLVWIVVYREGFSWHNHKLQFNLHPVLMVAGFITFSGFSILIYRLCRCRERIYMKLFHTFFHTLSIPCIMVGFVAVLEFHKHSDPPIPHFYSVHSWLGFITMGLFALQFVFGFIFFMVLACGICGTEFKEAMAPIHASFGLSTFMLAIATCLTGLSKKANSTLGEEYEELPEEGLIINSLAMVLVVLAIIVGYICARIYFKFRKPKIKYETRSYTPKTRADWEY